MIRTIFFWTTLFLSFLLFFPIVFLLKARKERVHAIQKFWARLLLRVSTVDLKIEGIENISPSRSYIIMANHQSYYDIFLLLTLPVFIHWMAKKELFKIPLLGWLLSWVGAISIDRKNRGRAYSSIKEAVKKIRGGATVLVFPEGTRSLNGNLLPFNKGGFFLATLSHAPVLPIVIKGTNKIMPKGSFRVFPGSTSISIKPPIETKSLTPKDKARLEEKVKNIFLQNLSDNKN